MVILCVLIQKSESEKTKCTWTVWKLSLLEMYLCKGFQTPSLKMSNTLQSVKKAFDVSIVYHLSLGFSLSQQFVCFQAPVNWKDDFIQGPFCCFNKAESISWENYAGMTDFYVLDTIPIPYTTEPEKQKICFKESSRIQVDKVAEMIATQRLHWKNALAYFWIFVLRWAAPTNSSWVPWLNPSRPWIW